MIDNVRFKLERLNTLNIINSNIIIIINYVEYKYRIINYLGNGSVGEVYLLERINSNKEIEKCVIKLSNTDSLDDLKDEVKSINYYFNLNKINHKYYPIYWGEFINLELYGIIYPFLGFYNLDTIKKKNYNINWNQNISIIKQLLFQLLSFKNIIHGDLKPTNVVVDLTNNDINATIIDFGLIHDLQSNTNIISTNYITSPESLLTLDAFKDCLNKNEFIDYSKHDYYGLYVIVLNLFLKYGYWSIQNEYLIEHLQINSSYILKQSAICLFTYMYYKFFYNNYSELPTTSHKSLILKIEKSKVSFLEKDFVNFDIFFEKYIKPNINYLIFDVNYIDLFKDFLIKLCHFDFKKREELIKLLEHPFIN